MHPYAALRERQRDPAGADAELERGPVAGEIRQEGDDRVDDGKVGLVDVPLVVALGHAFAEVVLGHGCTLSNQLRKRRQPPFRGSAVSGEVRRRRVGLTGCGRRAQVQRSFSRA